ncbi:MAG: heparan-alpha-glucosaminide N-acetyltransferase domain-containing protein [Vicinamibacterales bacterium]
MATGPRSSRLDSIDLVRGLAMVLMAIDHVRVYSGVPAGGPTPGVFFTRWVTHFVAPAFVFLAGTAIFLHARRLNGRTALARFLVLRGLWLVALELTVLRVAWTFNLAFDQYLLAGVIWMIGWCMVAMAAIVFLPVELVGAFGVVVIAGHNLVDLFAGPIRAAFETTPPHWMLKVLYFGGAIRVGADGPPLLILFVILPWLAVMMTGYAFGRVMLWPVERRACFCLRLGLTLAAAFVVLRYIDVYGDPRPWHESPIPVGLAFLNTTKYPASLLFLLMTLGPVVAAVGLAERWRGRVAEWAITFGRVPLFYYLLHIPLIHLAAMAVSVVREGHVDPWLFGNHPMAPPPVPEGYTWSLGLLYLVFAICVTLLYFPCRWFERERRERPAAWMAWL